MREAGLGEEDWRLRLRNFVCILRRPSCKFHFFFQPVFCNFHHFTSIHPFGFTLPCFRAVRLGTWLYSQPFNQSADNEINLRAGHVSGRTSIEHSASRELFRTISSLYQPSPSAYFSQLHLCPSLFLPSLQPSPASPSPPSPRSPSSTPSLPSYHL